ncbi:TadE/TadG family type IV pilus assembly protein [Vibrio sp. ER1A]|uniref:TadE/TadG family type IV pilus assembly protein n=1 Tax=Vibrio sp. ER1A TaxID=1517681 RepID=UPI0004DCF804|nr:TadE family protein [Vibrio sp. ER1A]KFA95550.1 pilus assembly protein TadE [Vibrio sp. ER1A]
MFIRISRQKGTSTVEFAVGAVALILTTLLIIEASYQIYVTNLVEYSLRETVRNAKVYEGSSVHDNYKNRLDELITSDGKLWSYLAPQENFQITGKYFNSYREFVDDVGFSEDDDGFQEGYALAEITLDYQYTPILNVLGASEKTISRTTVLTLEHEGWEGE